MKEFFGWEGYGRTPEGFLSWQHILFVTALMVIMAACAVFWGLRNRAAAPEKKNRVLIVAALLIDGVELFKIVISCFRSKDPLTWLYDLPLFLCSILLIAIPLAAFSKGRVKESALDFVFIFGLLAAIMGTYCAGNNYGSYPVLSFDNVVSGITHAISGFASLYVAISGMVSMRKRNIPITMAILLFFCVSAMIANAALDYNYMFLIRGDGTPYDIVYNLVGGHPYIYPLCVIFLFFLYITVFYVGFYLIKRFGKGRATRNQPKEDTPHAP